MLESYEDIEIRDFQHLDTDGRFIVFPEYPEFAWVEGIVNAIVHRDYSIGGDHIRVFMFDDRLEIFSPGKLPNIVTLDTIHSRRFSRNPRIARVLTELSWVKEMNEGVQRIYDLMKLNSCNPPIYSEPNGVAVLLVLENNIKGRNLQRYKHDII